MTVDIISTPAISSVTINNRDVSILEHKGQRVVTLSMIDEVHQRPEGTARRNFNANKGRLIEGEDYFVRNSSEARELGFTAPKGLVLIAESGYPMLVKSFSDDLAWQVQRQLVNSYFRKVEDAKPADPMALLNDPAAMRAALLGYTEKVIALESVNAELAPKAAAHDRFSVAAGEYGLQETAKIIQVKPKVFMDWLDAHRCRYSRGAVKLAYQDKIDAGYFRNRATYYTDKNGEPQAGNTIRVTPKGLTWLAKVVPGAKIDPDYTVSIKEGETPVPFSRPKEAAS